jgi:Zn finger protein HypA/HybF involved in hydrogenase expression
MHEMGLCEAVLGVVRDVSGDEPVSRVRLRVGQRQGVVPDVFEMCWRMAAQDTGAADAALELADVAGDELTVVEVELRDGEVLRNPNLAPVEGS